MKETEVILEKNAMEVYGKKFTELTHREQYGLVASQVMKEIMPHWRKSREAAKEQKQAYYLSAEYLMGRALGNNLINLSAKEEYKELLCHLSSDLNEVEEAEPDAGLGNGGLGRLAACFLDSGATLDLPLNGYGIRYEYGIFEQKIVNGGQFEVADDWGAYEDPFAIKREDEKVMVKFGDQEVYAVPFDTPVVGYGGKTINTLRLFAAKPLHRFDFTDFNESRYTDAVSEANAAHNISRVLYPNDSTKEGKVLRLKQEYFFTSAALQDLLRGYKRKRLNLEDFHKYHAVQLNDTHPAVAVPELIRLLMKEGMDFEKAFDITIQTLAYTNHTILQEALEKWNIDLFKEVLPEVYPIIEMIQTRLEEEMKFKKLSQEAIAAISIINRPDHLINMAFLAIYGSHSTNGVAELHTKILKETELHRWFEIYPERFNNKTNGITQRRWLLKSNPELAAFITRLLGSDAWITDLSQLDHLKEFAEDENILQEFMAIKKQKKEQLAHYLQFNEGKSVDATSIFDVQVKRIHEYKRQLMNALHILDLYYRLKEGRAPECKRTFIFGGKAAPGYFRAKGIIKFINEVANLINSDEDIRKILNVIFVENFNVSYGEKIYPAADISEQISTTGKEASGTGNMKFMLNGACTIGTLDGANVEIVEEAGIDNNFIFGLKPEEMATARSGYNPKDYLEKDPGLKRAVESLIDGTFADDGTGAFQDIYQSLVNGTDWQVADEYYILKDFAAYRDRHEAVCEAYLDELGFAKKCFLNMAGAGKFSSDRTINQYADEIWNIHPVGM